MQLDSGVFHSPKSHVPRDEETTKLDLLLRGDGRDAFKLEVDSSIRHTSLIEHGICHGGVTGMKLSCLVQLCG
jgi:hypothetical protein